MFALCAPYGLVEGITKYPAMASSPPAIKAPLAPIAAVARGKRQLKIGKWR